MQIFLFSLPAVPLAVLLIPMNALLAPFYAAEVGLSLAATGVILLFARVTDVVTDPMIGALTDRTPRRWSRRKLWMLIGAPITMAAAWMLLAPPASVNAVYFFAAAAFIYLGWTMISIPYAAWVADLTKDYHYRSKLAGAREAATVVGILIAASVPAITASFGHGIDRFTMATLAGVLLVLTPICIGGAALGVDEPPAETARSRSSAQTRGYLISLLKNGPFMMFIAAFFAAFFGHGINSSTLVFYTVNYLEAGDLVGYLLFIAFIGVIAGVWPWLLISRRIGRHRAIAISLGSAACLVAGIVSWLGPGDGWIFVGLLTLIGFVSAGFLTLPVAVVADIADYDLYTSSYDRKGALYAIWSLAQKLGPAVAVGVTLPILQQFGFNPTDSGGVGSEYVKYAYCFGPTPFYLLGAYLFWNFPLDQSRQREIAAALHSQDADR